MSLKIVLFVLLICWKKSHQHGYMSEPPSRASAWLVDQDFVNCCKNYDYNQMFCGGKTRQWEQNGGKCGICGDPWDGEREFEKGGDKYLGKIVRNYSINSVIPVKIQITANHLGYMEFRLCNIDNWETDATQECLNKTILAVHQINQYKYPVDAELTTAEFDLTIPNDFKCNHCVLQWKYVAGNSWGHDDAKSVSCKGCGVVQEHFYGCADIAILDEHQASSNVDSSNNPDANTDTNINSQTQQPAQNTENNGAENSESQTSSKEQIESISANQVAINHRETDFLNMEFQMCSSKLEYGSIIDLTRVVDIYCNRMCKSNCKQIVSNLIKKYINIEHEKNSNKDLKACFETCSVLCDCK